MSYAGASWPFFLLFESHDKIDGHDFLLGEILAKAGNIIFERIVIGLWANIIDSFSGFSFEIFSADSGIMIYDNFQIWVCKIRLDIIGLGLCCQPFRYIFINALDNGVSGHGVKVPIIDNFKPFDILILLNKLNDLGGEMFKFDERVPKPLNLINWEKAHFGIFGQDWNHLVHAQHLGRKKQD